MKNLSLFIFSLAMILVMASCKTTPETPTGKDKPEKTTVTTSLDLNGKWIVTGEMSSDVGYDKYSADCKITQNGNAITLENLKYKWVYQGNIEGNSILLEPVTYNVPGGYNIDLHRRELKISQDGNTLKGSYTYETSGGYVCTGSMKETYSRQ